MADGSEPLTDGQIERVKTAHDSGLDPHQRLRLACLQIVGRVGCHRADPRALAEQLFDYVLNGAPVHDDASLTAGDARS